MMPTSPSAAPTVYPTSSPSYTPSIVPSLTPSSIPSALSTVSPSFHPTTTPSRVPSQYPTMEDDSVSWSSWAQFNGVNTSMFFSILPLTLTNTFTLSAFVEPIFNGKSYTIMSMGDTKNSSGLSLGAFSVSLLSSGHLQFLDIDVKKEIGFNGTSSLIIPFGLSTHVSIVKNYSTVYFYINGALVNNITSPLLISYGKMNFFIGQDAWRNSSFFYGGMSHLYVTKKAESSDAIQLIYASALATQPTLSPTPVATTSPSEVTILVLNSGDTAESNGPSPAILAGSIGPALALLACCCMGLLFFARRRKKEKEEKEKAKEGEDEKEENELDAKDNAILNEMEKAIGEDAEHEVLQLPVFTNEKSSESGSTKVDDVRAVATTGVFIKGSGSSKIKKEEEIRSTEKAVSAPRRSSWNMEDMETDYNQEGANLAVIPKTTSKDSIRAAIKSVRKACSTPPSSKRIIPPAAPSPGSTLASWNIMGMKDRLDQDVIGASRESSFRSVSSSMSSSTLSNAGNLFNKAAREERKSLAVVDDRSESPTKRGSQTTDMTGLKLLDTLLTTSPEEDNDEDAMTKFHLGIQSRAGSTALDSFSSARLESPGSIPLRRTTLADNVNPKDRLSLLKRKSELSSNLRKSVSNARAETKASSSLDIQPGSPSTRKSTFVSPSMPQSSFGSPLGTPRSGSPIVRRPTTTALSNDSNVTDDLTSQFGTPKSHSPIVRRPTTILPSDSNPVDRLKYLRKRPESSSSFG
eukprot:CAMPEP_0182420924 /NCGR_PEP_ID=MMETSP1167-20130531/6036_1 /TAXON_ID=2988 /ORGANISM="Mallomonas Sp, Strain CCMP3275" /LENGTH=747 /DNA_ID=CAMNT_0024597511 /DNA_START=108 /DNA_END=2351 /DNA_ORIENTATION=+